MKELKASQIALETGGIFQDADDVIIDKVSKLEEGQIGSLGFFANAKYEKVLYSSQCSVVFVPADFTPSQPLTAKLINHQNPYFAFCTILAKYFDPNEIKTGIESTAAIHHTAKIGEHTYIGHHVTIEANTVIGNNVKIEAGSYIGKGSNIGDNSKIYANVSIYSGTIIGKNCVLHSGTVVGSDGFGFAPIEGKYVKIPQVGIVTIEDDVEIGANCAIDRATMGSTLIKRGTKLDNLVQIAHNVELGSDIVIASQTGIAGSTKVGNNSIFGGQVGVVGHLVIAPNTSVGAQAGITQSVSSPGQKISGTPATDVNTYLRGVIGSRKVTDLIKDIQQLKKEIEILKSQ
jgi:UDP-3-O-[3-hydroxymyristoyl] glucosamine N-acyltransferase